VNKPGVDAAGKAAMEAEAAIREYELSRDRYFQSLRLDAEESVAKSVATRREKLIEEIENLRALAKVRAEARTQALRAYQQRCPGRVTATSLLPPAATDRMGGANKLFKAAVKVAEEFNEVNDILKKRREALEAIEAEMRTVLQKHNDDLIRFLETPSGLENAFKRDPLLGRAHARMKAAIAARDAAIAASSAPVVTVAPAAAAAPEIAAS
jgi:hypothetical protein